MNYNEKDLLTYLNRMGVNNTMSDICTKASDLIKQIEEFQTDGDSVKFNDIQKTMALLEVYMNCIHQINTEDRNSFKQYAEQLIKRAVV